MPDARARRERRADWPVTRATLESAKGGNIADETTPAERIAMMWDLAVEAWAVAGIPIPDFEWPDAPSRLIRAADVEELENRPPSTGTTP